MVKHRFVLALPRGEGRVFLSWRLLRDDLVGAGFHVERRRGEGDLWARVAPTPALASTTRVDRPSRPGVYEYRVTDEAGTASEVVSADAGAEATLVVRSIPLDPEVTFGGLALGELTNDGCVGYVVRAIRGGAICVLAYAQDGRFLWERDTGLPAAGGWDGSTLHVPLLCWDVNGDGRTEVAFHTSKQATPAGGYEVAGPDEFLTVVDAETGALVWECPWPATRSRVVMTVGHLRGVDSPPSLVVLDETYGDVTLTAINGVTGAVDWRVAQARPAGHNLDIADIDEDGVQEVICGGMCYRGDGGVNWEAEPFGHTDISKPAKIDPSLAGLQIWYAVESGDPGVYLVDSQGRTRWKEPFRHAHYGWVAKHWAEVPGLQPHTAEDARAEYDADGARSEGHFPIFRADGRHLMHLTDWQRKSFVPVHWDEGPEVVFAIRKENKRVVRLLRSGGLEDLPESMLPEGGLYGRNLACCDIVGDFRENIVTMDETQHRLIVLANPTPARSRRYSPYDDFAYRHDRSQHASGYYIYLSPP
jgi:hypothetical protein